jgi:hypothetical protein
MVVQFFGHIDKEDVFCLPVYCWGKLFVVHGLRIGKLVGIAKRNIEKTIRDMQLHIASLWFCSFLEIHYLFYFNISSGLK